jgi:hypothetical protein
MAKYIWKKNLCCIATYKTLEGNSTLDEFEEVHISFDAAPTVTMKELRYYPQSTTNSDIIEMLAHQEARAYFKLLVTHYVVKKELGKTQIWEIISAFSKIFRNGDKTILDLAELTDLHLKFSDE